MVEANKQQELKIAGQSHDFDIWLGEGQKMTDPSYSIGIMTGNLNDEELTSILRHYNFSEATKPSNDGYELINVVMFTSSPIDKGVELKKSTIDGLLTYSKKDNSLYTEVYRISDGQLEAINELSLKVKYISTGAYHRCAQIFRQDWSSPVSTLSMMNSTAVPMPGNGADFSVTIENYLKKINHWSGSSKRPNEGDGTEEPPVSYCEFPCPNPGQIKGTCIAQESQLGGESWSCYSCSVQKAGSLIRDSGDEYEGDDDLLYDFRDNFLNNSSKGQEYVGWFYQLSTFIYDDISLSLALQAMDLLTNTVEPLLLELLNNPGSTDILYDETTRDVLVDFMNQIRELSDDPEFLALVDSIIDDINHYTNFSIADIVADFS